MKVDNTALLALIAATALTFSGCGSNDDDFLVAASNNGGAANAPAGVGTLTFREDVLLPDVDTLELTFLDAQGVEVGSANVSTTGSVTSQGVAAKGVRPQNADVIDVAVPNVPLTTRSVDVDYLRNGGYRLANETETVSWNGAQGVATDNNNPVDAAPPHSNWKGSVDQNGRAHLSVDTDDAQGQEEFLVKGIAYSPAPIGYNTRQSLDLGDFFWDTPAPTLFIDWDGMWKRDLEKMREMGFNTIRVYNMIPYHLRAIGPNDAPISAIPDPDKIPGGNDYLYDHTKFLDACWNNGKEPIYVIVGISMPDEVWYKQIYDNKGNDAFIAAVIKFWEGAFPKMVEQTAHHPAVLGYTMFNEKAFPQYFADTGGATAEFWWSQVKRFSEQAKTLAPDKLVGWATNDDPTLPTTAKRFLASHGQAVDFFGVNGYQTEHWNASLDNYKRESLGDLARPVILTEFGMPNTTRTEKTDFKPYLEPWLTEMKNKVARLFGVSASGVAIPQGTDVSLEFPTESSMLSIVNNDPEVLQRSAEIVGSLTKKAYEHPICVGQTYFDWSDEWWKQESYAPFSIPNPRAEDLTARKNVYGVELLPDRQEGGNRQDRFPGGYWDEEGFGLHSIALNPKRKASQVFADKTWKIGANTTPDLLTPRQLVVDALIGAYQSAQATRDAALGQ